MDPYAAWLDDTWTWTRFDAFCRATGRDSSPYAPDALARLGSEYLRISQAETGLSCSLANFWNIRIAPHLGGGDTRRRVGVFAQDFPLPRMNVRIERSRCNDPGCRPFHGECELSASIMRDEVAHVRHGNPAFVTLAAMIEAGSRVFDVSRDEILDCGVVGDVVKVFAPFDAGGRAFTNRLGRQSAHTRAMYAFAGSVFAREAELLQLQRILLLGFRASEPVLEALDLAGWHVYRPTDGTGRPFSAGARWTQRPTKGRDRVVVALPHPRAQRGAHAQALHVATGGGEPPPQDLLPQLRAWLEAHRGPLSPRSAERYEGYGNARVNAVAFFPGAAQVGVVFAAPSTFPWAHSAEWAAQPFERRKTRVVVTGGNVGRLHELLPLLDAAWPE